MKGVYSERWLSVGEHHRKCEVRRSEMESSPTLYTPGWLGTSLSGVPSTGNYQARSRGLGFSCST